ncbi:MAG: hydrolase TatD [Gammaproteobacteria bacterium RIFCSPLOWO2_02_FULL_57_10]|nr:MAG: hydrolase TatD [Gammaproteobacteria bacterium RIFCSPLOWO2_02_FULL_57_10]
MHCHLDLYPDPAKVAAECRKRGIYVLSVTTTPSAWHGTNKLALGNEKIRTALGLHPQLAHHRSHEVELFNAFISEAKYVGEIGLDGSKEFKDHWKIQLKVFRQVLKSINNAGGRIMTIHSRSSAEAVLDELEGALGVPILHWFTGSRSELKRAVDMGCWFSVGPAMLSTKKGADLLSLIPRHRVLTETDGPFAKFNGKTLNPWDCEAAVEQLANLWAIPKEDVCHMVKTNLKNLVATSSSDH